MTLSRREAGADLAAIDDVVARVKQSRIYRVSADITMFWGAVQIVQYFVLRLLPPSYSGAWVLIDALGVVATLAMLRRVGPANGVSAVRMLGAYLLFYGFGFVWSQFVGHFEGHATAVFWHTLFLFGYCVAGLWFGFGFLAIGLGLSAAILLIYAYADAAFWPLLAAVSGGGYILCGLWMRRA